MNSPSQPDGVVALHRARRVHTLEEERRLLAHYRTLSREAGWTLDASDTRRDLFYPSCVPLNSEPQTPGDDGATPRIRRLDDRCGWCGRGLTSLLDLDLSAPELSYLRHHGARLRIPICNRCSYYATIFTRVHPDGHVEWSDANRKCGYTGGDDDEYIPLPETGLRLGAPRGSFESHQFVITHELSQIGGHAGWINHAYYPEYPSCAKRIPFVAQISV